MEKEVAPTYNVKYQLLVPTFDLYGPLATLHKIKT